MKPLSVGQVAAGAVAFMARVYWTNAQKARHPIVDAAMEGQAMLWGIVTSSAPECVRKAADNHLRVIREHPDASSPNSGMWSAV